MEKPQMRSSRVVTVSVSLSVTLKAEGGITMPVIQSAEGFNSEPWVGLRRLQDLAEAAGGEGVVVSKEAASETFSKLGLVFRV